MPIALFLIITSVLTESVEGLGPDERTDSWTTLGIEPSQPANQQSATAKKISQRIFDLLRVAYDPNLAVRQNRQFCGVHWMQTEIDFDTCGRMDSTSVDFKQHKVRRHTTTPLYQGGIQRRQTITGASDATVRLVPHAPLPMLLWIDKQRSAQ